MLSAVVVTVESAVLYRRVSQQLTGGDVRMLVRVLWAREAQLLVVLVVPVRRRRRVRAGRSRWWWSEAEDRSVVTVGGDDDVRIMMMTVWVGGAV